MAKGKLKRKPQGQSTAASTSQKTVSSSPHRNPEKASWLIPDSSPKWRGKLYDHWIELVVGSLVVLFLSLWVAEYREHESTKAQLARAEDGKKQATDERDQARKDLKRLQTENVDLRKLHPILEFYGPHAKLIASYDLKKEVGRTLLVGNCPRAPCILITLRGIRKYNNEESAEFLISGDWTEPIPDYQLMMSFKLIIKQGCSSILKGRLYDITFVIEEDRITDLRAGVGVSPGTYSGKDGRILTKDGC
jgi:hypothetical protein